MTQLAKLASLILIAAVPACAATPAAAPQHAAHAKAARVVDANAGWTLEGFGGLGYTQVIMQERKAPAAAPRASAEPVAVSR